MSEYGADQGLGSSAASVRDEQAERSVSSLLFNPRPIPGAHATESI